MKNLIISGTRAQRKQTCQMCAPHRSWTRDPPPPEFTQRRTGWSHLSEWFAMYPMSRPTKRSTMGGDDGDLPLGSTTTTGRHLNARGRDPQKPWQSTPHSTQQQWPISRLLHPQRSARASTRMVMRKFTGVADGLEALLGGARRFRKRRGPKYLDVSARHQSPPAAATTSKRHSQKNTLRAFPLSCLRAPFLRSWSPHEVCGSGRSSE